MTQSLDALWDKICSNVRQRTSPDAFQRWFAPTRLMQAGEDALIVVVPNMIHQLWIESNYATTLQDAIVVTLGDRRVVRFHVDATAGRPAVVDGPLEPGPHGNGTASHHGAMNGHGQANGHAPANGNGQGRASDRGRANGSGAAQAGRLAGGTTTEEMRRGGRNEESGGDSDRAEFNPAEHDPRNSFENFVVGASNQFAHAAALAVAENPARIYNPLFIHGGVGLGKTHLMQAIGHHISRHRKKARVVYVSSEQFTNEFIDAIQHGGLPKFRRRYRQADVLLIDDVQFFAGKDRSQDEFFHTFNALFDGHRQIVMTSDRPPSEMAKLEARLVSRFEWGIAAEMQVPDEETRIAILRTKMAGHNVQLPEEIVRFLAERISNNVRRLEGALVRLASYISLSGEKLTQSRVEELLRDLLQEIPGANVTIDRIQRVAAEYYDVRLADMTSKRRPACIAFPRQVAMFLSREHTRASFAEIGAAFGGRDHGTVMYACKLVARRMADEPQLRSTIMLLQSKIRG